MFSANTLSPLLLVGVSGRSCSGKGVITNSITSFNNNILLIQADLYFHKKTPCSYAGYQCWEHVNCLALDRLIENLISLKNRRETTIHVESPWMPQLDIKISEQDLKQKQIIIVDGFLNFVVRPLVDLFDYKVFIQASDYNILYRRQMRDGISQINYINDVVIPVSKEYEQLQINNSDIVIDGNRQPNEIINDFGNYLLEKTREFGSTPQLKLAPQALPWRVHRGDLVTDKAWHPIAFEDLKDWVKKIKGELDAGVELKGNTFRYRKSYSSDEYEIRMSSQYRAGICRYSAVPSPIWR